MRIISTKRLREFYQKQAVAEAPLKEWIRKVEQAEWTCFADVRGTFRSADRLKLTSQRTLRDRQGNRVIQRIPKTVVIFNVGGNNYRLIASINYTTGIVYTLFVLNHADYSRGDWKDRV